MRKFKHFPPLFCKNAEINASPPVFVTMRKCTHLPPLFFKNAEINTSPPAFATMWKCMFCKNAEIHTSPPLFTKMKKLMHLPPLFCKHAEIHASHPLFPTMQKGTHLPTLFFKIVVIQTFPSAVFNILSECHYCICNIWSSTKGNVDQAADNMLELDFDAFITNIRHGIERMKG
jgi:hypothetical protein